MDIEMAEVTEIVEAKVRVKFNQDDVASALEYPKLSSYKPIIGDKVLMLKTNTSYFCLGGVGDEPEEVKENPYLVGEYKFFAKDKGLLWRGWAKCDGRSLSKTTYAELFGEIGAIYGEGGNEFNLPDAIGRVLSDASGKTLGLKVGLDSVTLTISQMPAHGHRLKISDREYESGNYKISRQGDPKYSSPSNDQAIEKTGGGSSHENRQPTLYGGYYYIYTGVI